MIKVLDSHCGSGKTSYAIQHINSLPDSVRVMYITPRLSECVRVQKSCPGKNFIQPSMRRGKGSKSADLLQLISEGENIAATHALFSRITDEMIVAIRSNDYILILDEVMDVLTKINLYDGNANLSDQERDALMKEDIQGLLNANIIKVHDDDDYWVEWLRPEEVVLNKYQVVKNLAQRHLLYMIDDYLIIWAFPVELFREGTFREIFILSYMFDHQIQAYYYNSFDIPYEKYYVINNGSKYDIVKHTGFEELDKQWRKNIAEKINICYRGNINAIGRYYRDSAGRIQKGALSLNWYRKAGPTSYKILRKNMSNFLKNVKKVPANQRLWTCYKESLPKLKGINEISHKQWLELNARAVNDYGNRNVLVYPINRFINPFYEKFFARKGVQISEEGFAF